MGSSVTAFTTFPVTVTVLASCVSSAAVADTDKALTTARGSANGRSDIATLLPFVVHPSLAGANVAAKGTRVKRYVGATGCDEGLAFFPKTAALHRSTGGLGLPFPTCPAGRYRTTTAAHRAGARPRL